MAERISGLVGDLRELWDMQGSNGSGRTTSIQHALDEIIGDLMPVAEAEGKAILLSPEARELKIEGLPRRGVFLLLQHALGICAAGRGDQGRKFAADTRSPDLSVAKRFRPSSRRQGGNSSPPIEHGDRAPEF